MNDCYFQDRIIEFALGLDWSGVPDDVRKVFRLSLLDWCAVGLAGVNEPVSAAVRDMVLAEGGKCEAAVFGIDAALPARAAALVNGAISHALDYDDTHFLHIGHPSVTIFPAALAVAQLVGATGAEFLTAALAGYEASVRIGHWLGRAHYEAGFHMTATAGCFGATIAAVRLLGADAAQMRAALGLASTRASGLKAQFGSMGKPYNAGMAASAGVEAALLAVAGVTSDVCGLRSFAAGHAGEMDAGALEGLGQVFVSANISHKFHACCHGTHAALEALAKLEVDVGEVTGVRIAVHPRWLKVCNLAKPVTGLEAKFSYRMCFAFALAGLETGALATFTDENCADPRLQALRDRVVVQGDATLADGAARVVASCHGDMVRQAEFNLDQALPLPQRRDRVLAKATVLIGEERTRQIWARIESLETTNSLPDFLSAQ
ncbi:MmgE/PrpD family protein [Profundibacter sp.]|uniref:MmgE/PrpD family protein n=1 Tax=Profundibacter sp. TaxID=3101071 RepID=UPI003D0FC003